MSTTDPQANAVATLQPVLSDRFALKWHDFAICLVFSVFFMYLSYMPLFHSDIWGHVLYGQWIMENAALPQQDPYMGLAVGMRVVDNAWASQVLFAFIHELGGPQGLSTCYAAVVVLTYLLQFRVFFLMSGSKWIALASCMFSLFLVLSRQGVIRPEIFGGLLFSTLLWVLVSLDPWRRRSLVLRERPATKRPPLWIWIAIPVMFAAWANLHGSFAVGLVVLACHAIGRAVDVLYRTRSIQLVFRDQRFRSWVLLTELAVVATLLNPYGIDLLIQTATFGKNPNLREVMEWFPLRLVDLEGIQFSIAALIMVVLLRHSRQRMHAADILMLGIFAFTTASTVRMLGWLSPILVFAMVPHLTSICRKRRRVATTDVPNVPDEEELGPTKFKFTLASVLAIWCAFSLSPASQPLLSDKPTPDTKLYSNYTPLEITEYLRNNPPTGLVYAPQWWADWMLYSGPEHLQVMVTTNIHLVPREVWRSYLQVQIGAANWERILDHYGAGTVIVHKELQPKLARLVRRSAKWNIAFESELGLVLKRNNSI